MVKSNRYHLMASLIGIVSVICLMVLYRQVALSSMVDHETRSNQAITALLSKAARPAYSKLLAGSAVAGSSAERQLLSRLRQEIQRLTSGTRLLAVDIHNPDGVVIFSTNASNIGINRGSSPELKRAMDGQVTSDISFPEQIEASGTTHRNLSVVTSHRGA